MATKSKFKVWSGTAWVEYDFGGTVDLSNYVTTTKLNANIEALATNISNTYATQNSLTLMSNTIQANYLTKADAGATYQGLDTDLTAIAGLTGTKGLLKKNGDGLWSLDTNTYLTSHQSLSGYAKESWVNTQISNLVNSAPEALNTLGELATALKNHEDAYGALLTTVGNKLDKTGGTISGVSTINTTSNTDMSTPSLNILHTGPKDSSSYADLMIVSGFNQAPYGFRFKTHGSGTAIIQSQRINNDGEVFPLSLNPNGGDVLMNGKLIATQSWVGAQNYATTNEVNNVYQDLENYFYTSAQTDEKFISKTDERIELTGLLRADNLSANAINLTDGEILFDVDTVLQLPDENGTLATRGWVENKGYVTTNGTQTISGTKTYTGNNIFKNNYFEIKASSANDDSWIKLTNATDSGYYAFGIRRPYATYGLQMKYHPASGSDVYYNIWHAGNFTPSNYLTTSAAASTYLGISAQAASAANADKLGGVAASSYATQSWVNSSLDGFYDQVVEPAIENIVDNFQNSVVDPAIDDLNDKFANYLPKSGGTLTGALGFNSHYLNKPVADFRTMSSTYAGAITITLPAGIGSTMTSMWIDVYNYVAHTSFSVHVGGYTYENSTWEHQPFAMVYGANHTVRLGHNGTNFVIYIGETNSTWSYPQITVRDVMIGYSHQYANWYKDWSIGFSTSFSRVTATISNYAWTTKNFNPSNYQAKIGDGTNLTYLSTGETQIWRTFSGSDNEVALKLRSNHTDSLIHFADKNNKRLGYFGFIGGDLGYYRATSDGGLASATMWHSANDGSGSGLDADKLDGQEGSYYQPKLTSGTNIKTVNGTSLLGSGNISISGGAGSVTKIWSGSTVLSDDSPIDALYSASGHTCLLQIYSGDEDAFGFLIATPIGQEEFDLNGVVIGLNIHFQLNSQYGFSTMTGHDADATIVEAIYKFG